MLAVQSRLPLILPMRPRMRRVRRSFIPSQQGRGYRLPRGVRDRLAVVLAPYRNRESAFALATFLGRFWSMPSRIIDAFPIDRRALAHHPELALTEKRVRSAIRTLEEIGFLDRAIASSGSRYKATEDGLHRKPIAFVFGSEYAPAFIAANRRAAVARGGHPGERRPIAPTSASRPSTASLSAVSTNGPKSRIEPERSVLMGPLRKGIGLPPKAFEPDANLEAALERLRQGVIGKAGGV
jgi:hypothetical protein